MNKTLSEQIGILFFEMMFIICLGTLPVCAFILQFLGIPAGSIIPIISWFLLLSYYKSDKWKEDLF